jgi:mitochondrial import receptor subunit TOM70
MPSETMSINAASPSGSPSSSLWDRLSTWASENKAVVYTIAGTAVVVTGAGVVYYLSESRKNNTGAPVSGEKRKSKKERRKEKKAAEDIKSTSSSVKDEESGMFIHEEPTMFADITGAAVPAPKATAVEAEDELPQIDETTVDSFSQEVTHLDVRAMLSTDPG